AYCWGDGTSGALGIGRFVFQLTSPTTPVAGGFSFATVSAGGGHTCGVTTSGAAYCWGSNTSGQSGDGTTTGSVGPVPVAGGLTFATVRAGSTHSCGVTTSREAYCWGANDLGQLGNGTQSASLTPTPVATGTPSLTAMRTVPRARVSVGAWSLRRRNRQQSALSPGGLAEAGSRRMGKAIRIATLPRQPIRPRVSLRAASCQPQSCCLRSSRRHVSAISPRDRSSPRQPG